ncbi:MAG: hypothetical protein HYT40_03660 [Candidatus Sungbacteria bacterium]|uniref:Uncharacterized protein n=1 Tax=Candidatus Sungiibacteriota bacterium TaxID=2750080 RepID=A0A931WPF2_9BACT|nr:hypothetical protein [Candidatus Sungbacteria bacterium]
MKHVWTGEEYTVSHHNLLGGHEQENLQCWTCANCGERVPWDRRDEECPGPQGLDDWEKFLESVFEESDSKPKMFIYKGILYEPTGDGRYTPELPQEVLDFFAKWGEKAR